MLFNEICPSCSFNILIIVQPAAIENPNPCPSNSFPINNSHPNSRIKNTTIDIAIRYHQPPHWHCLKTMPSPPSRSSCQWQRNIRPLSMIRPPNISTTIRNEHPRQQIECIKNRDNRYPCSKFDFYRMLDPPPWNLTYSAINCRSVKNN